MNLHAEGNGIPYLGVEMRQDGVADAHGQAAMAQILAQILGALRQHFAPLRR
jgi:predicted N-formylglutamate amidohydrolase